MRGTLQIGALVAIANDLDEQILISAGKVLPARINSNEAETNETVFETEGKGNEGTSALINLEGTVISCDLLNSLWLLQMMQLET